MKSYQFATIIILCETVMAALSDSFSKLVPAACTDACASYINTVAPCLEKTGPMSLEYDNSVSTDFTFNGNKLGIYFCMCSNDAMGASSTCLDCLTNRYCLTPPLNIDTYKGACSGSTDVNTLLTNTKATC